MQNLSVCENADRFIWPLMSVPVHTIGKLSDLVIYSRFIVRLISECVGIKCDNSNGSHDDHSSVTGTKPVSTDMRLLLKFNALQGKHFAIVIRGNLLRLRWGSTVCDFILLSYFIRKYKLSHHACLSICLSVLLSAE